MSFTWQNKMCAQDNMSWAQDNMSCARHKFYWKKFACSKYKIVQIAEKNSYKPRTRVIHYFCNVNSLYLHTRMKSQRKYIFLFSLTQLCVLQLRSFDSPVILKILNLLDGCKYKIHNMTSCQYKIHNMTSCQYKIHNMTSCHICIVNFVFTHTQ